MAILTYRIWDKVNKKMIYPNNNKYIKLFNDGSWSFYTPSYSPCFDDDVPYLNSKEGILMWGTGEGDINGDEIYERDIIKSIDFKKICVAKIPNIYWECKGAVKIIGNVFENPELLGGER